MFCLQDYNMQIPFYSKGMHQKKKTVQSGDLARRSESRPIGCCVQINHQEPDNVLAVIYSWLEFMFVELKMWGYLERADDNKFI